MFSAFDEQSPGNLLKSTWRADQMLTPVYTGSVKVYMAC